MALAKTLWQQIQDLVSTGQNVSDQLDTAFNNIDTAIEQIDTNTSAIVGNASNITTLAETALSTDEKDSFDIQTAAFSISKDPTGWNLRDNSTHGVMELCGSAASGEYWRINENNIYSKITGATTFGDGVTPLVDLTFAIYPVSTEDSFSLNT